MKVKDLPEGTIINHVLVKIPDYIQIPDYGTAPQREVYIRGYNWGSLFVSLQPSDERIYPILCENPDPGEWEVIDEEFQEDCD